jgi:hypothetical protein
MQIPTPTMTNMILFQLSLAPPTTTTIFIHFISTTSSADNDDDNEKYVFYCNYV